MSVRFAAPLLLLAAPGASADEPKKAAPAAPTVVKLAAPTKPAVQAGGGRFLVLHLPKAKQIAVFDVREAKVVKSIPAPEDDILVAGAREFVFVVRPSNNTLQRWSLATFEKEATLRLPVDKKFDAALMGCGANGPLLLRQPNYPDRGRVLLLNPVTGREVPCGYLPESGYNSLYVSPCGQVFSWRTNGIRECAVVRPVDGKFAGTVYAEDLYGVQPGPGGRFLYSGGTVYNEQMRRVHPEPNAGAPTFGLSPTVHWPLCVSWERVPTTSANDFKGYSKVHLFLEGQFKPIAALDGLEKYDSISSAHFLPRYGRIVFVNKSSEELTVLSFDFDALLAKSETDFLLVLSEPPQTAVAGKTFEYAPVARSRKGGVKWALDAGPDGMKLGADGKLTWAVPAMAAKEEVGVILSATDATGRDAFHAFKLAVVPLPEKP